MCNICYDYRLHEWVMHGWSRVIDPMSESLCGDVHSWYYFFNNTYCTRVLKRVILPCVFVRCRNNLNYSRDFINTGKSIAMAIEALANDACTTTHTG